MSMFDPFKKLKLASAFLGAADDAARTDDNIDLSELFGRIDLRGLKLDVEKILAKEGVRELYESRYLPRPEPIERMLENGEGTLGYEVARYLRVQKMKPVAPPANFDFRDPATYIALRVRMTHALMHVITEYDASPLGELALQSYYVGQLGNLISGVIISSGLLQITRDMPEQFGAALEMVAEAYDRGREAKPLLGTAWEELWSAQVPQLRELIDLLPRRTTHARLDLDALEAAAAPPPAPTRSSSSSFASFGSSSTTSTSSSSSSMSGFVSGFINPSQSGSGRTSSSSSFSAAPAKPAADTASAGDGRVQPRTREPSQSSLLASFLALAEQESRAPAEPDLPEAEPEPVPEPPRPRQVLKPPPPPPARQPSSPLPAPPQQAARPAAPPPPAAPEAAPGFTIEESDPGIQPAQPGDPDFF